MNIVILTPRSSVVDTNESLVARLTSDFLHLLGHDGHRFDSFEQLRDFAQAQIDAASLAARAAAPAPVADEPVTAPAPVVVGDAANAVTGQPPAAEPVAAAPAPVEAAPESIVILTPPPVQP